MLKDLFLNETENAIILAIKNNTLGQMTEYIKGTLSVEKPKNSDFGDFAINVSSLARNAKIAPPQIANAICENLDKDKYGVTVVGGFINFKVNTEILCDVVEEIFKKFESVKKIKIRIFKENPPIAGHYDSVGIELERDRK